MLAVCLLVGTMAGAGVVSGPAPTAGPPALVTPGPQQTGTAAPDLTRIGVDVAENGTATWRIAFRFELADNESQTAFEGLRTEIQQNPQPHPSLVNPSSNILYRIIPDGIKIERTYGSETDDATVEQ